MVDKPTYGTADPSNGVGDVKYPNDRRDDDEVSFSSDGSMTAGVKRIEAVSTAWTKWSLALAYIGYEDSFVDDEAMLTLRIVFI